MFSPFWRVRREVKNLWARESRSFILKRFPPGWHDSFEAFEGLYNAIWTPLVTWKKIMPILLTVECKSSFSVPSSETDQHFYLSHRGCSELCRIPMVEYKLDSEGTPCEYKTPFRRNTTWHRVPTPAGQPLSRASPILGTSDRLQCQQLLQQAQTAIPRSTSFDRKLPDGAR